MRILNLYSGIGGNRKLWQDVEVTAIEYSEDIANVYKEFYPNDKVIVTDAHQYLLENYKDFDFVWSSPPCQSHSGNNKFLNAQGIVRYPDMKLWQEIIFLQHFCKTKFVVENVIPYYEPFVKPTIELGRHYFWSNFKITRFNLERDNGNINDISGGSTHYGVNLRNHKLKQRKDVILRNMVNPKLGLHVLNCAVGAFKTNTRDLQTSLWNAEL